jgi:sugar phosphate isomerase/epimerase
MRPDQLAVQLYTLRDQAGKDLPGTLRAVAAAGYRSVELAGLPAIGPEALRDLLAQNDLRPMGSHESLERLRSDLAGTLRRLTVLGCPRVIVPWLPDSERATADGARALARELGQLSHACAERGIRLGFHNHAYEFAPLDGTTIWQVLLDELPPEFDLELDVYWAAIGGRDPAELIRGLDERLRLLHMKDLSSGPDRGDLAPGDGILAWPDIVEAGTAHGIEWYVVEEDNPRDAVGEIERGRRYLAGLAEAVPER